MEVFKSKRFWTALLGIVSMVLVGIVPELEPHLDTLIPGILGIVGLLIGGYSLEDAMQPKPGRGSNSIPSQVRNITVETTGASIDNVQWKVGDTTYRPGGTANLNFPNAEG